MSDGSVTINFNGDTKDLEKDINSVGSKIKSGFSKIGSIAGTALKGATVAVGAVSTALVGLGTASVNSYADLEQNVGGIETLFKDSADTVIKNAENAYKTAGMSANDYMSTVTSFSASLLQSLGGDTAAAAKSADMAIIDMADNANKMGTSMESIQWAYQGFAKQNYTMLDNLKLGYGGTKEEMERLLADAQKLTGVKYDITNLNDVYNAIHVIQGELGITGTTAKEASETITGSISSMKAAFDNFLNGSGTIDQLVQTGITSIQNIVSAVGKLLPNLVQSVADATPQIVAGINQIFPQILNLITQNAPTILNSIGQVLMALVQSLMDYMPQLMTIAMQLIQSFINGLISMLPQIIQMGVQLITQLITGIAQMLPQLIPQAVQCIVTIVTGLLNNIDQIIDAGLQLIMGLVQGLINAVPQLINAIPSIITGLVNGIVNNLPKIIEAGIQLVLSLATGLIQAIPQLVMAIPQIVGAILQGLWELPGKIWEILVNIVTNFINWGLEIQAKANEAVTGLVTNVINWFKQLPGNIWNWLVQTVTKIAQWGINMQNKAKSAMSNMVNGIINTIKNLPGKMLEIGKNIVSGIWNGISNMASWLWNKISGWCSGIFDNIKSFFGIHSPSTLFADEIGTNLALGLGEGFDDSLKDVYKDMRSTVDFETQRLSSNLSMSGTMDKMISANITLQQGDIYMDSTKVGRAVTPTVSRTLSLGGVR